MRKRKHPSLFIDERICTVFIRKKEQASGNIYPYWYAYWRESGRSHSKYLGKTDPRLRYSCVEEGKR